MVVGSRRGKGRFTKKRDLQKGESQAVSGAEMRREQERKGRNEKVRRDTEKEKRAFAKLYIREE